MLKIYGVYRSRASRIYWMAEELGLHFESVPVVQARLLNDPSAPDAPVNTRSPSFLAVNAMGQIPSIEDDGLVLHESLAITLYLARKHGGPLHAQSVPEDGLITMWTLWAATQVEPQTVKIVLAHDTNKQATEDGRALIMECRKALERPLAVLEHHLQSQDWLLGDRFTVADLNLAEVMRYAQGEQDFLNRYPEVTNWLARCQSRPAFRKMWDARTREVPVEEKA